MERWTEWTCEIIPKGYSINAAEQQTKAEMQKKKMMVFEREREKWKGGGLGDKERGAMPNSSSREGEDVPEYGLSLWSFVC